MENGFYIDVPIPEDIPNDALPDPGLLLDYRLAESRIHYIDFEIDLCVLDIQRQIILYNLEDKDVPIEERKPIKILIDSPGGLLSETMSLAYAIKMSKTPVWTFNMADAYSGAAVLLMSGHKRFAMPNSIAMIHTGESGLGGTYEQVEAQSKKYQKQIADMGTFILNNTSIDQKLYKKNKAKDWYMDSNEQVSYGLVDEIIDNLFEIL